MEGWVADSGARVRVSEQPGTFHIELDLPPERWFSPGRRVYSTEFFLGFDIRFLPARSATLFAGDMSLPELERAQFDGGEAGFFLRSSELNLRVGKGERLPKDLRLVVRYPLAERGGGEWSPLVGGYSGQGLAVPSGTAVEIVTDVLPGSYLRFHAVGEPLAIGFRQLEECRLTFRVHLNDELIFEESEFVHRIGKGRWHELAMPGEGARDARLRFSVAGPPAIAAFYQPTLGPRAATKREGDRRPNLMLVVLDTLRADSLQFYGGDPEVAPNLNAFSDESVRFSRAWSSASWTLPSHGSMMSGLHPEQHGALYENQSLPSAHVTLAEHLRVQGYRTMAATEGLFVSRRHGIDQGFELFFANSLGILPHTLEKATSFLEADDGRPTFLFLHTYRAHTPYRLGQESDDNAYRALMAEMAQWEDRPDRKSKAAEFQRRLSELYYGGVSALDEALGPWLQDLEDGGFFENGYLIMTSDHGDELLEHGRMGHGHRHWEELTHIPLLIRGRDLLPQTIEHAATLVDLAPTFTSLAGVPGHRSWVGESLLGLQEGRIVYTFNSGPRERWMTLHVGDRKVFAGMDVGEGGEWDSEAVFDLHRDPFELDDLQMEDVEWVRVLLRGQEPVVEGLLRAKAVSEGVELSEEELAELRALGYGG